MERTRYVIRWIDAPIQGNYIENAYVKLGATRALTRLGLADDGAERDVAELRELLRAWRDAKRSAWKAAVGWVVRLVSVLLLAGLVPYLLRRH